MTAAGDRHGGPVLSDLDRLAPMVGDDMDLTEQSAEGAPLTEIHGSSPPQIRRQRTPFCDALHRVITDTRRSGEPWVVDLLAAHVPMLAGDRGLAPLGDWSGHRRDVEELDCLIPPRAILRRHRR